ncbi:c-type cytochrome biogenesis protein CcmI [Nitratireductor sp. GISD-1A_MAKvit]|uniref:c-type cytochrome biogenesis protein CcmI n=1 Tax=Nitratireductor sp. GISD-1A_MAKvit TaxID=3234198 RepID=UPI0034663E81
MLFWILAAFLTFVAALAVMWPFAVRGRTAHDAHAHDLEVYRDQLFEVERDLERGLIGQHEAEQARAEIGRRILRISETREKQNSEGAAQRVTRVTAAIAVLAVPLISWGVYAFTGSPSMPAQPLYARDALPPAEAPIDDLVARAEAHLADNPDDSKGWQVLAPVYMRLGRFGDAQKALRNLIRLEGASADRQAALGEAIVGGAQGMVTAEAETAFKAALDLNAREPRARFFLALARAQDGATKDAQAAWSAMLVDLPEASPWHAAARQALASSSRETRASGPTRSDIEDATELSSAERQGMIEGMVASLDSRLRDSPDDLEGWQRLVRAYMVLQRPDDARAALNRALDAYGPNAPEAQALEIFAQGLGLATE